MTIDLDIDRDITKILMGTENVKVAVLIPGPIDVTVAVPPLHLLLKVS
jgi:hypothetical protein